MRQVTKRIQRFVKEDLVGVHEHDDIEFVWDEVWECLVHICNPLSLEIEGL